MKKINLAISGCMGRMGQQLIRSANNNKNFKIVSLTENRKINKKILGIKPRMNSLDAFKKAHMIVDFTVPKCTLEILKIAVKTKKKVVVGTLDLQKKRKN
jgi:Dihydrodipicolinate reductase